MMSVIDLFVLWYVKIPLLMMVSDICDAVIDDPSGILPTWRYLLMIRWPGTGGGWLIHCGEKVHLLLIFIVFDWWCWYRYSVRYWYWAWWYIIVWRYLVDYHYRVLFWLMGILLFDTLLLLGPLLFIVIVREILTDYWKLFGIMIQYSEENCGNTFVWPEEEKILCHSITSRRVLFILLFISVPWLLLLKWPYYPSCSIVLTLYSDDTLHSFVLLWLTTYHTWPCSKYIAVTVR